MPLKIVQTVIDCADAASLAGFWAAALGREVDAGAQREFATIGLTERVQPVLMFIRVPEAKTVKNRVHLDLAAGPDDDWRAEVQRLIALGASQVGEHREFGWHWITLTDPEGNEFDLGVGATE